MPRHSATLACGSALFFEAASFTPAVGESVPCLRHAYCSVVAIDTGGRSPEYTGLVRAQRRTISQLIDYLERVRCATATQLRKERFTLRLIEDAVRIGTVVREQTEHDATVRIGDPSDRCATPVDFGKRHYA